MTPILRLRQLTRMLAPAIALLALSMVLAPEQRPDRPSGATAARLMFVGLPVGAVTAALPVVPGRS